ncbi:hypothetical protein RRG08_057483 [Elysia crispata]|uniref:Ig-like domain-containing protein n=1 Tax=Elysia crispata TaxID=231223 RepID=A0AAE0XXV2_9GAST|nr:hypothetical protein RRG08_057483 [Elysia crispata]
MQATIGTASIFGGDFKARYPRAKNFHLGELEPARAHAQSRPQNPDSDPAKVTGTPADKTVTLSFSQASHSCRPQAVQGYFLEESTTCTCSLSSDGHPRGTAQWYKGGQLVGSGGTLVVSRDKSRNKPEHKYYKSSLSGALRALADLLRVGTVYRVKFIHQSLYAQPWVFEL